MLIFWGYIQRINGYGTEIKKKKFLRLGLSTKSSI